MMVTRSRMANVQNGYDGHDNSRCYDGHNKFFASRPTRKGLILPEDFFGGRHQNKDNLGDAFPHPRLCRYTVCKKLVRGDLLGCRSLTYNQTVTTFQCKKIYNGSPRDNDKSFYGSVSEVKNVFVTIPAVFGPYQRPFFRLHPKATQAYRHQ